jgi:hypothetical protein
LDLPLDSDKGTYDAITLGEEDELWKSTSSPQAAVSAEASRLLKEAMFLIAN